jgi:hypothetical protein
MSSTPPFETFPQAAALSQTPAPGITLWVLVALVSPISEIACQVALGSVPGWLIWVRIFVLIVVAVVGTRWDSLAVLRPFAFAYLVQLLAVALVHIARNSPTYTLMAARGFGWSELFLTSVVFAPMIPAWVWCSRRPDRFFLHPGESVCAFPPVPRSLVRSCARFFTRRRAMCVGLRRLHRHCWLEVMGNGASGRDACRGQCV